MQKTTAFEFETINDLATLLQTEVIRFTEENFRKEQFPVVKNLTPSSLINALTGLSGSDEAKASLEPQGYIGSAVTTLKMWGQKATSSVGLTYAPIKYHRLPHLLYFAEKAQALKKLTAHLLGLAESYSALFDEDSLAAVDQNAKQLVIELEELFNTTKQLLDNDYTSTVNATINKATRSLQGMKGGRGNTELGANLTTQILDKYQPQCAKLSEQILDAAKALVHRKQVERASTFDVIERTTKAAVESRLRAPGDFTAMELARARELTEEARRKQAEAEQREKQSIAQRAKLEQENIVLRQKLATASQASAQSVEQTQGQVAFAMQRQTQLKELEERRKAECQILEQEIASLKIKLSAAPPSNSHTSNLKQEHDLLSQKLKAMNTELAQKATECSELEAQNISATLALQNALQQAQAAKQQAAALEQQRLAAEQHASQLQRQLQAAHEQLISAKVTVDNLVEKNEATHEKFAKVREVFHKLDDNGYCQLHRAILANDKTLVAQLLLTSDANHKTQQGYSPLYLAIFDLKTPYKLRDDLNVDIVKLLLDNDANPNEHFGHCSYLHAAIFQRNNSKKRPYEPRGKKTINLKLIEALVMHGASLESVPDDEPNYSLHAIQDNIPGIIADKNNKLPIALLLRTCVRYSVKSLTELMQSQEIINTAFARLQENKDGLIQREAANLSTLFIRYSPIFTIYLNPRDHVNAIETFNKLPRKDLERDQQYIVKDIMRISKIRDSSKQGEQQKKGRNAYDDIIGILNELDACISKVIQMYEVRYQCSTNPNTIYILTEFEQGLIIKNLPAAQQAFAENETEKLRARMKQAEALRGPQANMREILTDEDTPMQVVMK